MFHRNVVGVNEMICIHVYICGQITGTCDVLSLLDVCDSLMKWGHIYGAMVGVILFPPLYFCCLKEEVFLQ